MVGFPFSGTTSNVTITSGTAPGITASHGTTNKRFIAVYVNGQTTRFYTSGMQPPTGALLLIITKHLLERVL